MPPASLFAWKEAPFLRLIIPFSAGILAQRPLALTPLPASILAAWCCLLLLPMAHFGINFRYRHRWLPPLLVNLLLFTSGILVAWNNDITHHKSWFAYHYQPGDTFVVRITEPLTSKTNTCSTTGTIIAIRGDHSVQPLEGKLLLYFDKQHLSDELDYGTILTFVKTPAPITDASNPYAFSYQQYCSFKGIFHQVYLREHSYLVAEKKQINSVKKLLFDTRKKMLDILRKRIPDKKQAGLAEALLIGYKNDLDKPLLQAYINTGVVHIIAISGLHLGLIYALLLLLSRRLPLSWQQWVAPVIIITLWGFVWLTGASPSALRSAIMFTSLLIGSRLPIRQSPFNALAASAFLLLWYDPWLCYDVGFQLSYAAVLGILLFLKPISGLLTPPGKLLYQGWQLIAVTLAAQVLTLPISLYHFHQLPNLFIITNLLAVPLSSLILIGEIILCTLSGITPVATVLGKLLGWLIAWLNGFIEAVDRLPFSTTDNIPFNGQQLVLLYLAIACFCLWRLQQKASSLIAALVAVWLLFAIRSWQSWQAGFQQQLTIYNIPRQRAVDYFAGRQYLYKGDSNLASNPSLVSYHIRPNRIAHHVLPADTLPNFRQYGPLACFGRYSVLQIDPTFPPLRVPAPAGRMAVDFIILSGNPPTTINTVVSLFDCSHIIIDATNSPWKTKRWLAESRQQGIPCHAIAQQGAFVFTHH